MAKITYMNGILSGRLGGLVYAYNKAGNYVRSFRSPTNPNTLAQINNRASFAESSSTWHALSDAQKAAWNTFAITNFKPKFGGIGTRFSGFNAFVSLNNVASNMQRQFVSNQITDPSGASNTPVMFANSSDAPLLPMGGSIKMQTGANLGISLASCTLTGDTGSCTVVFNLTPPTGTGPLTTAPAFQDCLGGIDTGIAIVASLPIVQNQQYVENPEINLVAVIIPPGPITGWTSSNTIEFMCDAVTDYGNRKLSYKTDDIVQFKAYLINKYGMSQPLNAVKNIVL
jgi:hypothetical protein